MTEPKQRESLSYLCYVGAVLFTFIAIVAVDVCINPGAELAKISNVRIIASYCALLSAIICLTLIFKGIEFHIPAFRLGGRSLRPRSRYIPYIRDLRKEFGITTSQDKLAVRNARKITMRHFRLAREIRRVRHPFTTWKQRRRARVIRHARIQAPARIIKND